MYMADVLLRELMYWTGSERREKFGAGEILLTSMDADGTNGYDIPLTRAVAEAVQVPVIAGGAGKLNTSMMF